jgi:thiol-disulfide isomerase/thioredoxin
MAEEKKVTTYTTPILIVLLVIVSFLLGTAWTRVRSLEKEGAASGQSQAGSVSPAPTETGTALSSTIGNFLVTEEEACKEDGQPLVYMFASSSCPHCTWEHPIFTAVTAKFSGLIALHDNLDTQDDMDVFQNYSQINQGGIPFIILGCRYTRVGSGENLGEEKEADVLTALICKLTDSEPASLCASVQDLIDQVK